MSISTTIATQILLYVRHRSVIRWVFFGVPSELPILFEDAGIVVPATKMESYFTTIVYRVRKMFSGDIEVFAKLMQ